MTESDISVTETSSPEAGWWQASDGKWYPPEAAAAPTVPSPLSPAPEPEVSAPEPATNPAPETALSASPPPPPAPPQPPMAPPATAASVGFCRGCGSQLPPAASFCGACGLSQAAVSPPVTNTEDGKQLGIAGLVCALVSLLVLPIIFGPLALVFGAVSWSKGNQFGMISTLIAIPCMLVGMFLGVLLWTAA